MAPPHYRIHGVVIQVAVPAGPLAETVAALLGHFRVADHPAAAYHITIRLGEPPTTTDGLLLVERHVHASGRETRHYADTHCRQAHIAGLAWHRLDLRQRTAEIVLRPGEEWCLEPGSLTLLLCEILAHEHQHVFHAATLVGETKTGPRAIILAGPSGVGKTTTALALARAGLPFLTDDATFLVRRQGALRVWGFPRPLKVHRQTRALLPWLATLEPAPHWRHDEHLLYPRRFTTADFHQELRPGLLVLLEPRNPHDHRFTPWDRLNALTEMTRQNVRSIGGLALHSAGDSFTAIGDLVTGSQLRRLSVGPNLGALAAALRRQLED